MDNDIIIPFLEFFATLGAIGDFGVNAYNVIVELFGVLVRMVLEVVVP